MSVDLISLLARFPYKIEFNYYDEFFTIRASDNAGSHESFKENLEEIFRSKISISNDYGHVISIDVFNHFINNDLLSNIEIDHNEVNKNNYYTVRIKNKSELEFFLNYIVNYEFPKRIKSFKQLYESTNHKKSVLDNPKSVVSLIANFPYTFGFRKYDVSKTRIEVTQGKAVEASVLESWVIDTLNTNINKRTDPENLNDVSITVKELFDYFMNSGKLDAELDLYNNANFFIHISTTEKLFAVIDLIENFTSSQTIKSIKDLYN
jgi:hypothetical protein